MLKRILIASLLISACNLLSPLSQDNIEAGEPDKLSGITTENEPGPTLESEATPVEGTSGPASEGNLPVLEIIDPSAGNPSVFQIFAKYINVFGVHIYATEDVPDVKMLHAAGVMAQYLDNDEDGGPDNVLVVEAMHENQATLIMFASEQEIERSGLFDADLPDDMILQDLYASETHPDGANQGRFDAALEEVLHLITQAGYASAYPDIFGEEPGSQLGDAMDMARGGQFFGIPSSYPAEAWYSYDDHTCEYDCQIAEYIYWALTSLLGGQDFPGRLEEIEHEWRLNTPEKLQQGDSAVYALLTDTQYAWPTRLPDGNYLGSP